MKMNICLDLDGTLISHWTGPFDLHNFGEPLPGAIEFTRTLRDMGSEITIFTCRGNAKLGKAHGADPEACRQIIRAYLDKHGFTYDVIYIGQGKPIADFYVDDRGVSCTPETDPEAFTKVLTFLRSQ